MSLSVVNRVVFFVCFLFVAEQLQLPYLGIRFQMSDSHWPGQHQSALNKGVCELLSGVNAAPCTGLTQNRIPYQIWAAERFGCGF